MNNRAFMIIASVLILGSLLVMGPGETAEAQISFGYSGLPTMIENDGKLLCIVGEEEQTFANVPISVWIEVDPTVSSFEIGIFDGDTGRTNAGVLDWVAGNWDTSPFGSYTQMIYELYPDPLKTGTTTEILKDVCGRSECRWFGNDDGMPNDDWFNMTVQTSAEAQGPDGGYYYRMVISPQSSATRDYSCFKLRSSGEASLLPGVFTVMGGPVSPADLYILFPSFPASSPSTYDGVWEFYAMIEQSQKTLEFWDGDFDFGDSQGLNLDDDDASTTTIPPWAGGGAVMEGAQGQGDPQDDNGNPYFVVSPNTYYEILDPASRSYLNPNPSGNLEWESFVLSTDAGVTADYLVDELSAGYYRWVIYGMDGHNLNAIHSDWELHSGEPPAGCTPGYWKQKQHFDSWAGYDPSDMFSDVFGVPYNKTLLEALKTGGGGRKALGRHAVAALLNVANGDVGYKYTVEDVIAMVQYAYETGEFELVKDLFAAQNELVCPLD